MLRAALVDADIVFIPHDTWGSYKSPVFAHGTEELYEALSNAPELQQRSVVIPVEERQYEEVALYAAMLVIGTVVVTALVLPTVANVLAHFIIKWLENTTLTPEKAEVRLRLVVWKENEVFELEYEGPVTQVLPSLEEMDTEFVVRALEELSGGREGAPK